MKMIRLTGPVIALGFWFAVGGTTTIGGCSVKAPPGDRGVDSAQAADSGTGHPGDTGRGTPPPDPDTRAPSDDAAAPAASPDAAAASADTAPPSPDGSAPDSRSPALAPQCGRWGQMCCGQPGGGFCDVNNVCLQFDNECSPRFTMPCTTTSQCGPGLVCEYNFCVSCGATGYECCADNTCNTTGAICNSLRKCEGPAPPAPGYPGTAQ